MSNIRSVPADVSISTKCDIESAAMKIVEEYVDIQYPVIREKKSSAKKEVEEDRVKEYGKEVLTLGCFYLEYRDAIREGDGVRVLRCWKFLLLYCRATGHSNYANEALNILLQHEFILPPRLSEQLLYSRFVNTAGLPGKNIAADLHLEHLNRLCKDSIKNLGANKTPRAFLRIGKSAQPISEIVANFYYSAGMERGSGAHTHRSQAEDMEKIIHALRRRKVFSRKEARKHNSFGTIRCNLFRKIKAKKFDEWLQRRYKAYYGYSVQAH